MTQDASSPTRDSLPKRLTRIALWSAVLLVVFGWLLPQFIDYDEVWDAIKGLEWWQLAILLALGLLKFPTEGGVWKSLLPELTLLRATRNWLIVSGTTFYLPPPADSVVFYALARTSGVESRRAITSSFLTFLYPTIGRLLLPLAVAVPYLVFAVRTDDETVSILVITLAVAVCGAVAAWLVVRSESSAEWLGLHAARPISWARTRFHRREVDSFGPTLVRFRADALETIGGNWPKGMTAVALNFAVSSTILLAALRFVGLDSTELPYIEVLAAYALSQWASTVIPISPGGLGISDAVLLGSLGAVATGDSSAIAAALVLWRVFDWALSKPVGIVVAKRWQGANRSALADARALFSKQTVPVGSA